VAYALASTGWTVRVLARREAQAVDLVKGLSQTIALEGCLQAGSLQPASLAGVQCDLIVNATPVGMYPEVAGCPWPEGTPFPAHAAVYDLIYNPLETALIKKAKAEGLPARNGLGMLAAQAALSFRIWTGIEPPFEEMHRAFG
jgi:shikimate 5-dehydrogenase